MDKSAIRNFAIEARKMLMKSAETEAGFYGVTKNGCKSPVQKGNDFEVYETIAGTENRIYGADIKRRANLVKAVETLGFEQVIEETAYTWFNRIIAIRFMEVNDYLPTRVRVLSSETGSNTPDIVTQSLDVDLNMTPEEVDKVQKAKDENRYDDAFRMLFIKQCNELNAILPGLFEKTDDYMELLLKLSYTSDGVIRMLVDSIDENNFNVETEGQIEIIGWMYQYYNTELKAEVFGRPSGAKIKKEDIPAATQLFTPDWIVRYMVENSVGRVWIEHLRALDDSLNEQEKADEYGWKYYLAEAEQEDSVTEKLVDIRKSYAELEAKDITCIDPCMGSGHILVYMFDVLMDIYRSEGFSERDAVFSILENNIRGLDIDKRAYQLSYFALMMKARSYNRTFFRGRQDEEGNRISITPMVFAIDESNDINREQLKYFGADLSEIEKNNAMNQMVGLLDTLKDAREYGSILNVDDYDWNLLKRFVSAENTDGQISFDTLGIGDTQKKLFLLIEQGRVMAKKYWVASTNPPYMGVSNGCGKLNDYVKKYYPDSKTDLFAVFIEKCISYVEKMGYVAMITQHAWMFLSSYEKLRAKLLTKNTVNMAHLGPRAFEEIGGEVVQTTSFVIQNHYEKDYLAKYCRLVTGTSQSEKEKMFLEKTNIIVNSQKPYQAIPGTPIAYWLSDLFINNFEKKSIAEEYLPKFGMSTGDGNKFIRFWQEVNYSDICFDLEDESQAENSEIMWVPLDKGGSYRKWYGNRNYIVYWKNNGKEIKEHPKSAVRSPHLFFKKHISWTLISTGHFSARWFDEGFALDTASNCIYFKDKEDYEVLGYLNSIVADSYLAVLNPTMNFSCGVIGNLPYEKNANDELRQLVEECIQIEKDDFDATEMSWDFKRSKLVPSERKEGYLLSELYKVYASEVGDKREALVQNEQKINEYFIELYGLSEELTPEVDSKLISIAVPSVEDSVKNLVSYAVGCMFGRYSLDREGLIYAGGDWNIAEYASFTPDKDGIIPITDTDYFKDDIVSRFENFVRIVYGEDTLEANLEYIAEKLGNKGISSREKIRNYFINDFFKDHCNMYSLTGSGKRPIYWLFDSGKQNGFKCLIYMHRYNKDTLNLIRSEYLHKTEDAVENALKNAEYIIQTSASAVERAKATKDRDRYVKQLNEMRIYYQALSHLALQKIEIDLDDGVKHNYQLFQGIEVIADGGKKQKVDLLAKI